MTDDDSTKDLREQAELLRRFAEARDAGLAHCACGRNQWTGESWLMREAIGDRIRERDEEGKFSELFCIMCRCYCNGLGIVHQEALDDQPVAGAEVEPVEDVSIAGDADLPYTGGAAWAEAVR